jgi:cytochrome c oxidase assembly factor CtaG
MNFFLAACQGAGLAVAAGALAGAPGRRGTISTLLLIAAVIGGAVLFGASLAAEDHPAWPGWPVGAAIAWVSFAVVSDFAAGAAARADGGGFIAGLVVLLALATAGLSVILPPLGLVALAATAYLGAARRERASRKYEGLRSLR